MPSLLFVLFLGIAAGFVEAQDQPRQPAPKDQQQQPQLDKDTETRLRTEHSAGGLGKITPEEKANANVGAGPHFRSRPGAAPREEQQESASERDASRGATR